MKKLSAVILTFTLIFCALAVHAGAEEQPLCRYERFKQQYCDGRDPLDSNWDGFVYRELYSHKTNGATDWVLIQADFGVRCEVLCEDVFFGRAFAANDMAGPFVYTYGLYDVERERFYDFCEIEDISRYPGWQEVLDEFEIGERIGTPYFGSGLLFKEAFLRGEISHLGGESAVKSYEELFYHRNYSGSIDWALVRGESWFHYPDGGTYETIGDRVFRTKGIGTPFGNNYAVYDVENDRFYELRKPSVRFPGLVQALDELDLGEKIGDLNADGRLDVRDATEMQRCLAGLRDYPGNDAVEAAGLRNTGSETVKWLSDFDRDGTRSISDVTATQRVLAEII